MGQSTSSLPSALPDLALHCLRVAENSPASNLIEPFFDYLVGLETDPPSRTTLSGLNTNELGWILEENEGRRIVLRVYNAKSQRIRGVGLVPSREWSEAALRRNGLGQGEGNGNGSGSGNGNGNGDSDRTEKKPSLLGLSLRACDPAHALESVYHVLDVLEGSPAEATGALNRYKADQYSPQGLVPFGDFVLAWSGGPLHSENDFYRLIEAHVDRPLRLFVHNSDLDNLREVVLYPTRQWGGKGLIGCGIGYGLLHRIPRPTTPLATVSEPFIGPELTHP
ncbi:MAG: hypothetical protein TREMPRED_000110 [Tremellales sp. Tagirdzhanova-0007]|nr:MAG: hypothetical protein TREMPRED_000110 [Tremellales sp. Tagirdzhanova-0007]